MNDSNFRNIIFIVMLFAILVVTFTYIYFTGENSSIYLDLP